MKSLGFRILLALTSFAPVVLALAISYAASESNYVVSSIFLLFFGVLLIVCYFLIRRGRNEKKKLHRIQVKEFSRRDQGIVVFLSVWMIPFLRSTFSADWATYTYVFFVVLLCMVDVGAYHFNPILRLFRYHFYTIRDQNNFECLLITNNKLTAPNVSMDVNKISDDVLIERRNTSVSSIFHSSDNRTNERQERSSPTGD